MARGHVVAGPRRACTGGADHGTAARGLRGSGIKLLGSTEQGFAGDGEERPLVPRSRSSPRLKPGVRLPWKAEGRHEAD